MKFDMSAAWSEGMAMVNANREVLLVVAGIFFFLPAVLQGFVMPPVETLLTAQDPQTLQRQIVALLGSYGWLFVLIFLAQIVGTLALLVLLRDQRRPTVGQAISQGFAGLLPTVAAYVLLGFAFMLVFMVVGVASMAAPLMGAVLSLIVAVAMVYAMIRLSLLQAVIAVEHVRNPLTALRRSWAVTQANAGRLLAFFLLLFVAYIVVLLVIGMVAGAIGLLLGEAGALIVGGVVTGLVAAIATMIFTAVQAAIHRQLAGPVPQAAAPSGL